MVNPAAGNFINNLEFILYHEVFAAMNVECKTVKFWFSQDQIIKRDNLFAKLEIATHEGKEY